MQSEARAAESKLQDHISELKSNRAGDEQTKATIAEQIVRLADPLPVLALR